MNDQERLLLNIRNNGVEPPSVLQSGLQDECEIYNMYKVSGPYAYQSEKFIDWMINYGLGQLKFPLYCNGEKLFWPSGFLARDCSRVTDNCVSGFEKCTMFNSREPIAKLCNAYLDSIGCTPETANPSGECNTLMHGICKTHPDLPECQCVNRAQYPDWNRWSADFLKYGSYKPDGATESKKEVPPAKCWYPYCQNAWLWVDDQALPSNGDTCGDIRYCKKEIKFDGSNTMIDTVVDILNTPCNCVSNADCKEGLKCIKNECVECSVDGDCPSGTLCMDGMCKECSSDQQCRVDQHCDTAFGKCVECVVSNQCPEKLSCVNNKCIECNDTVLFCPDGKFCVNNRCVECLSDSDCSDGKVCRNNTCVSTSLFWRFRWWLVGGGVIAFLVIVLLVILLR